jgi:putative sterol carrier protein
MAAMSPEELAKAIDGRTDEEILKSLEGSYLATLEQIFGGMKDHFMPERATGQTAVMQYEVKAGDETFTFHFKVDNGTCEWAKGAAEAPRVTMSIALPDFLRLVSGKLNGMQAFFAGKLKLAGDMMFAQTFQSWFNQPTPG